MPMDTCTHDNASTRKGWRCSTCRQNERYREDKTFRAKRITNSRRQYFSKPTEEQTRKRHLRRVTRLYNLPEDEYNRIVAEHNGICDLCGTRSSKVIDHNHRSGDFRGLICSRCNIGLGYLDDQEWAQKANEYLSANGAS